MRKRCFLKAIAGFTLIELIVVIAILAIATSIVTPILMDNANSKKIETYRQSCIYVMDEAAAVADSYNNGARYISNEQIDPVSYPNGVKNALNNDNSMAYRFTITTVDEYTNPNEAFNDKDYVVVYYKYKDDDNSQAAAVGCWYMEKGKATPQLKYDYATARVIPNSQDFTAAVYR
ncbi:MAG: type II secretion system protein [Clostridia bacterium]|nr:type II secretion system protein [Clostridia bacterium]